LKTLKAAGALALLALAFPASALAHGGSASVSCTAADFDFYNFYAGSNTVHYKITVDNVPVASGSYTLNQAGGARGALHVPLAVYGSRTVAAYAWWGPVGTMANHTGGSATVPMDVRGVSCGEAPPAATPPAAAPTPAATAPASTPAAAAPAPQSGVLGEQATAPARVARLGAQARCTSREVQVTVAGRSMRRVTFTVNGRKVRTVNVRSGRRSVRAALPMRNRRAAQVVRATVSFRNGARPRTLVARTSRCAQAAVQPQFTG
jgi:hypothetical protein